MSGLVPIPADGEERYLVLSLVNTVVRGAPAAHDRLGTVQDYLAWAQTKDLPSAGSGAAELATVVRMRSDARLILASVETGIPVPAEAISRMNRLLGEPVRPVLRSDLSVGLEPVRVASVTGGIARDLTALLGSSDISRLRTCAAVDCDRMFLGRHGRQLWCSIQCGGRMRARRHASRRTGR